MTSGTLRLEQRLEMTVTGYLAGNQVASSSFTLNQTRISTWLNFSGVDSVHIVSAGNN
jgi:hypothetical protein